ncbi:hypothetical protein [Oricola sp.]|uniref:hypothetical protein n=1 Tax=Oricola sp. TaxID=1979950 RepID=UPI0025ECDA2D|nr:hypothetical protein [Oricola sp.]MCI5073930.1 hypothetical protein [Oricola sp.]
MTRGEFERQVEDAAEFARNTEEDRKKPERYRFLRERVENSWFVRLVAFLESIFFWR